MRSRPGPPILMLLLMLAGDAEARRYPITKSDSTGTWVGTRGGLLHGMGELWKRYGREQGLPSSRVNDVELTSRSVWVATPRGLARLDKGTRRWEVFRPPNVPSAQVNAVSVDPSDADQVWVGTAAGLANYNVRTNAWRRFDAASGLPHATVNDVLFRGRTVWVATDDGLAAYDVKLRTWTVYGSKQGLASARVLEIDEQGADLWFTCAGGLSRMNLQRRTFSPFRVKEGLPSTTILAQARMQNLIYFVTDKGVITYDTSADALAPFLHAKGLLGAQVRSVASAGGFLWFATDKGLSRFDPVKKVWQYYKIEDGLSSEDLDRLAVAGGFLLVFTAGGGLDTYDYKKDEWVERPGLVKEDPDEDPASQPGASASQPASGPTAPEPEPRESKLTLSASAELDTELKQGLDWSLDRDEFERDGYWLVNTLRLGTGAQWGGGRSVDFSGALDWGDISPLFDGEGDTLGSFQRYEFRLRYLGLQDDFLREVLGSSQLRLEPEGGRLTERTELEGGRVVVAAGPRRRGGKFATVQASAGLRRGTPMRVVFRRPDVGSLQIKRFKLTKRSRDGTPRVVRYVIPSSVRATLDGKELERNVDYFVDHENGVLWIKNTDLVHMLRVLEVEFEYEQIPRKSVGAVSMTDLLPRDGNIGQLKRAGTARWAKDEQGLFDEIDGGAEQYINRGWDQTLSQDFEWGSAGIILRIHDMADEKNARSIFLARKLPDAKPVPGLPDVFLEKQTASLSIKLVRKNFFIEISIDQPTLEQEIVAIAGWLVGKLEASTRGTSADDLRDVVMSANANLRFTDDVSLGLTYLGSRSVDDAEVKQTFSAIERARDVFAVNGRYARSFGDDGRLEARLQAAASNARDEGSDRAAGNGVLGQVLFTSPWLVMRAAGRRYSREYEGIGVARQTEFCRTVDGICRGPGTSRLHYEVGVDSTVQALSWLPVNLFWQRQVADLGRDYDDAPADRERTGTRDVALGSVMLSRDALPRLTVGGGYVRRDDALADQGQARASGALEADLAEGLLSGLKFKKLYLRGLYEFGRNQIDEYHTDASTERDRIETMHHAVGELRLAPSLTESGYATLEYHGLRGALDSGGRVVDRLTYWRLDAGAGSSIVPGIAARFDTTIWFGDDRPLVAPDPMASSSVDEERKQEADSRLSGVLDVFPGEWLGALGPIKLNVAYTYTQQAGSQGSRTISGTTGFGKEICNNGRDDDADGATDCDDPECSLEATCLVITGEERSHRVYGTALWDTPGKLQVELFADLRWSFSDKADVPGGGAERVLRLERQELRSFVTWRPIHPSPITLRLDLLREEKRPERYDSVSPADPVQPRLLTLEPALEWRRRWSARWWHLAKLTVSHTRFRDQPHIRTIEDQFGKKGDLERLDYDTLTFKPSLEVRRHFEDEEGLWNVRPYVRASYAYQMGTGVASRIDQRICLEGDACLSDGSETSQVASLSVGVIWVHSENVFVDLDLNTSYKDCRSASTGSTCDDTVTFTPHLLATVRY